MSNKYQAYAEYKDSGVEWLGSVPEHWEVKRIKETATLINGYPFDSTLFEPSQGIPLVRIRDINSLKTEVGYSGNVPDSALINNDDILIGMDGDFNVAIWSGGEAALNQRVACIRAANPFLQKLIFYTLPFNMNVVNDLTYYTTVKHLSSIDILKTKFGYSPENELSSIVNFLDHETVKIDTLIEKQQQLIKLLKEKRQAVISHAVTKGLNPNAPMRDSGVEWLGEVPEHWDICLIKFKCQEITDGSHVSPVTEGGEHYFVSITDVKKGVINFENSLLTTSESFEYLVKTGCMPFSGDILFSKDGTIGQTAITPDSIEFVVASSLIIIRPNKEKVRPYYLDFLLQSDVVVEQVESFVKGAALRRLSIQNLLKIGGAFPPITEQVEICLYLIKILEQYDDLEIKANDLIKLLQERRSALISAAVTGKIDVRNWQAPNKETMETSV